MTTINNVKTFHINKTPSTYPFFNKYFSGECYARSYYYNDHMIKSFEHKYINILKDFCLIGFLQNYNNMLKAKSSENIKKSIALLLNHDRN